MKLLALVSGGKDSILSMMEAVKMGHTIGCIANVYPIAATTSTAATEEDEIDEIDSHCFQTVGHANIEQLATCLEIPLRRRGIREGQSVNTELVYKAPSAAAASAEEAEATETTTTTTTTTLPPVDEVEELFILIKDIITEFPDIQGVCSGAILSTYQRLRVESICERLGLQSFGYLWSMDGGAVLDLVGEQSVNAILIKVATVGLVPRKHLGQSLMSETLRDHLLSLEEQYQVHPAGEGGEFESFVLDCPLFPAKCLAVASKKIIIVDDNPISPTGRMEFTVEVVDKSEESLEAREEFFAKIKEKEMVSEGGSAASAVLVTKRDSYSWKSSFHACGQYKAGKLLARAIGSDAKVMAEGLGSSSSDSADSAAASVTTEMTEASIDAEAIVVSTTDNAAAGEGNAEALRRLTEASPSAHVELLLSAGSGSSSASSSTTTVADQLRDLLIFTNTLATQANRTVRMLLVLAPDLGDFLPLNKAYAAIVGGWALFPSRAFVGTGIANLIYLRVLFAQSNTVTTNSLDTLRIQSISHWGAATIGPYGQTVVERFTAPSGGGAKHLTSMVISGQIALTPSSLTLVNPDALFAAALEEKAFAGRISGEEKKALLLAANDDELKEWRRFAAEFCVMLSNSLCPMMAMGPRESGDVWAANSTYAWRWLVTSAGSKAGTAGVSKTAIPSHTTKLDIYLIDKKHAMWAQWLWDAIVVRGTAATIGADSGSTAATFVQPNYIIVKGLPRAGIVEMVTKCEFGVPAAATASADEDEEDY